MKRCVLFLSALMLLSCSKPTEGTVATKAASKPATPTEVCTSAIAAGITTACKPNAVHADDREFQIMYAGDLAYSVMVQTRPTTELLEKAQLEDQVGLEIGGVPLSEVSFYMARDRRLLLATLKGPQSGPGRSKVNQFVDIVGANFVPQVKVH